MFFPLSVFSATCLLGQTFKKLSHCLDIAADPGIRISVDQWIIRGWANFGDDVDTEPRYNIRFVSKMPSCVGLPSGVFEPLLTQLRNLPQHSFRPIVNIINHNLLSRLEPVHSVLCFGKPDKIQFTAVLIVCCSGCCSRSS